MLVKALDHYNILTPRLAQTLSFYTDVLEMKSGPTPSGGNQSAWLYDSGDRPIVHVQSVDPAAPERKFADVKNRLGDLVGDLSVSHLNGSGSIEHIALECFEYERTLERMQSKGLTVRINEVTRTGLKQIFIKDPNGIILELNFRPG